mmetsp:Transcript_40011/g.72037  ORF Transcript_40011/g.72037 Transcript_40011/m.72037 type:complete len:200 (+) Transcript_40011:556-1155(+)
MEFINTCPEGEHISPILSRICFAVAKFLRAVSKSPISLFKDPRLFIKDAPSLDSNTSMLCKISSALVKASCASICCLFARLAAPRLLYIIAHSFVSSSLLRSNAFLDCSISFRAPVKSPVLRFCTPMLLMREQNSTVLNISACLKRSLACWRMVRACAFLAISLNTYPTCDAISAFSPFGYSELSKCSYKSMHVFSTQS